jgi:hypothetical protein
MSAAHRNNPAHPLSTVDRRALLRSAAWTVPAVAAATIAPRAAASQSAAVILAFDRSSYAGVSCGTISGASVVLTVGGVPAAGHDVTITLAGGYRFADGTATLTLISDANGRVALPAVAIPPLGGAGSITAISAAADPVSVGLTSPAVTSRWVIRDQAATPDYNAFGTAPASAQPVTVRFLLDGTDLYHGAGRVDTGVTKVIGGTSAFGVMLPYNEWVQYLKGSTWIIMDGTGNIDDMTLSGTPSTAVPVSLGFLLDGTTLYYNGSTVDTNVTRAIGGTAFGASWVQYLKGTTWVIRDSWGSVDSFRAPATATGVTQGYVIDGSTLYRRGSVAATGVTKAIGGFFGSVQWLQYLQGGTTWVTTSNESEFVVPDLEGTPVTATPLTLGYCIDGTTLYFHGIAIENGVTRAIGGDSGIPGSWVQYRTGPLC